MDTSVQQDSLRRALWSRLVLTFPFLLHLEQCPERHFSIVLLKFPDQDDELVAPLWYFEQRHSSRLPYHKLI